MGRERDWVLSNASVQPPTLCNLEKTRRAKQKGLKGQDEMEGTKTKGITEGENATVGIKGKKRRRIRGKKTTTDKIKRRREKWQRENQGGGEGP